MTSGPYLLASDLEILPAYVLGGQDAYERSDEFRPEALEHVWWHGSSEHGGAGKLNVSLINLQTAIRAYRYDDVRLDVVFCSLSGKSSGETNQSH